MIESKSFSSVNSDTFVSLYSNSNSNSNGKNDYKDCWSNPELLNSNSNGISNEYNDCWSNPDLRDDEARSYAASASIPRSILLFGKLSEEQENYSSVEASFESLPFCSSDNTFPPGDNQFNREPEPYNSTLGARERSARSTADSSSFSRSNSKPIIPPLPQLSLLNINSPHVNILGAAKDRLQQGKPAKVIQGAMKKERNEESESMEFFSAESAGHTPPEDRSYVIPIVTPTTPPLPDITPGGDQRCKVQTPYGQQCAGERPTVVPAPSYFDFFNFSCCMKSPCAVNGWSCDDPYNRNELQYMRPTPRRV